MDICCLTVFNLLVILVPIITFMFYLIFSSRRKEIILEISLFISLYLSILIIKDHKLIILFSINLPLLILFYKQKEISSLVMSTIISFLYSIYYGFNPLLVFIEYLIYYIIFIKLKKNNFSLYFLINVFFSTKFIMIVLNNIIKGNDFSIKIIFIEALINYAIFILILLLFIKTEEMTRFKMSLKQINESKILNESLFKITHEIKNPIAVCKGYLEMLDVKDQKQVEKYIPVIKQEIDRTLFLMEDFKNFANQNIERENIDIMELLDDVCLSLKPMFEKENIKTDFNVLDEEIYIEADYNKLKQVFVNVLKNAKEAVIEKDDPKVLLKTMIKDKLLTIIISDNGSGVTSDDMKKIFEPFYTTKEKGTGLGLPLSKDIIEKHGGKFDLISKKGSLTKIVIELPLQS